MMTFPPALLALGLAVAVLAVGWAIGTAWPQIWPRRIFIVVVGVLALYSGCLIIAHLAVRGWPPGVGLAELAPIWPAIGLLVGWRLTAPDERGREQRQRLREQEARRVALQRDTIGELQSVILELQQGVLNVLIIKDNPSMTLLLGSVFADQGNWVHEITRLQRRMEILSDRLDDEELRGLVQTCGQTITRVLANVGAMDDLPTVLPPVVTASNAARARAGALYRALGAPTPPEPERPWWRNLWDAGRLR